MLKSRQKCMLQEEGYTAREKGTACPHKPRSDKWHYWQTGWLMRHHEEEENDAGTSRPLTARHAKNPSGFRRPRQLNRSFN